MKRCVRITALFMIFSIAPLPSANAYPGPPPGHHYKSYSSSHTEVWVDATGLAVLLATLAAGNGNNEAETSKQQAAYDQKIREIKEHARESSKKEMDHAGDLIFERGVPAAVELLTKSWESEGKKTFLDDRNGVSVLKVSGFEENVRLEYTIRKESKKISVRVTAPDYAVSEESGMYYKEPLPVSPSRKHIGLEFEEMLRDPRGRLLIKDVAKGTALFYAGVVQGDTLVRIDSYDTKDFDIERLSSYLGNRAAVKATVKITVSQKGELKVIDVQL